MRRVLSSANGFSRPKFLLGLFLGVLLVGIGSWVVYHYRIAESSPVTPQSELEKLEQNQNDLSLVVAKLQESRVEIKQRLEGERRRYNVLTNVKNLPPEDAQCQQSKSESQHLEKKLADLEGQLSDLATIRMQLTQLRAKLNIDEETTLSDQEKELILKSKATIKVYKNLETVIPVEGDSVRSE